MNIWHKILHMNRSSCFKLRCDTPGHPLRLRWLPSRCRSFGGLPQRGHFWTSGEGLPSESGTEGADVLFADVSWITKIWLARDLPHFLLHFRCELKIIPEASQEEFEDDWDEATGWKLRPSETGNSNCLTSRCFSVSNFRQKQGCDGSQPAFRTAGWVRKNIGKKPHRWKSRVTRLESCGYWSWKLSGSHGSGEQLPQPHRLCAESSPLCRHSKAGCRCWTDVLQRLALFPDSDRGWFHMFFKDRKLRHFKVHLFWWVTANNPKNQKVRQPGGFSGIPSLWLWRCSWWAVSFQVEAEPLGFSPWNRRGWSFHQIFPGRNI